MITFAVKRNYNIWRDNILNLKIVVENYLSLSISYIVIDKSYAALVGKINILTSYRNIIMRIIGQKKSRFL